jgi:alanine racemase
MLAGAPVGDTTAPAELWAVVKADGYGHGARDCAAAALDAGAAAVCLATVPEAFDHPRHGYVGLHVMWRVL